MDERLKIEQSGNRVIENRLVKQPFQSPDFQFWHLPILAITNF